MDFGDLFHDLRAELIRCKDKLIFGHQGKSRRRDARVISEVPVEYTILEGDHEGYRAMATAVNDISLSGMNVLIDKKLPEYTILQLRILLSSRVVISLRGSIAWQNTADRTGKFTSGIKFVNISPETSNTLADYLKSLSR